MIPSDEVKQEQGHFAVSLEGDVVVVRNMQKGMQAVLSPQQLESNVFLRQYFANTKDFGAALQVIASRGQLYIHSNTFRFTLDYLSNKQSSQKLIEIPASKCSQPSQENSSLRQIVVHLTESVNQLKTAVNTLRRNEQHHQAIIKLMRAEIDELRSQLIRGEKQVESCQPSRQSFPKESAKCLVLDRQQGKFVVDRRDPYFERFDVIDNLVRKVSDSVRYSLFGALIAQGSLSSFVVRQRETEQRSVLYGIATSAVRGKIDDAICYSPEYLGIYAFNGAVFRQGSLLHTGFGAINDGDLVEIVADTTAWKIRFIKNKYCVGELDIPLCMRNKPLFQHIIMKQHGDELELM